MERAGANVANNLAYLKRLPGAADIYNFSSNWQGIGVMRFDYPEKFTRPPRPKWPFAAAAILIVLAGTSFSLWQLRAAGLSLEQASAMTVERYPYVTRQVEVASGAAYGSLMEGAGIGGADSAAIFAAAADVYDLSRIRAGRMIELTFDRDSGVLRSLSYQIDSEEKLRVSRQGASDEWLAERSPIPYETRPRTVAGEITTSLYEAGLAQDIDERAIIALADVFQWTIDFVLDVRVGDRFKFIYEERYLDGQYMMPGDILAAEYLNDEGPHYAFFFRDASGKEGYFDETGASVQRVFLKTPAEFKYISSGFTTGQRYVSAFNVSTGHRAIDYAAPTGTPVRTVGEGKVVFAGWGGAYGNKITVRHNAVYSTNYCHLSKFLVKSGQTVSQGQTIGLVGSTGFSTGPHLHYEMVKNGTKINPLREEFPSVNPVPAEEREAYLRSIQDRLEELGRK